MLPTRLLPGSELLPPRAPHLLVCNGPVDTPWCTQSFEQREQVKTHSSQLCLFPICSLPGDPFLSNTFTETGSRWPQGPAGPPGAPGPIGKLNPGLGKGWNGWMTEGLGGQNEGGLPDLASCCGPEDILSYFRSPWTSWPHRCPWKSWTRGEFCICV